MTTPGKTRGIIEDDELRREQVGSTLLHELAEGLYGWQEVIREYVQNAVDSHLEWAEEDGQFPAQPIQIEVRSDRITFYDFGIGMDEQRARDVKAIGISTKARNPAGEGFKQTGYKGVGIWAGLSFFEQLVINTTALGSDVGFEIRINFKGIKDAIAPNVPIFPVINSNHEIERYDANSEEHHTTVSLIRPRKSGEKFLVSDEVQKTVSLLCPCRVDPSFHFASELQEWQTEKDITTFDFLLDGEPVYRKYQCPAFPNLKPSTGVFKPDTITVNDQVVAHVWYVLHRKNGALPSTEGNPSGLRLLQNGFMMGAPSIYSSTTLPGYESLSTSDYLNWYTGEIYVIWEQLKPNLRRNEFQESEATRDFIEKLRDWYRKLIKKTRDTADERAVVDKHAELEQQAQNIITLAARTTLSEKNVERTEKILSALRQQSTAAENSGTSPIKARKLKSLRPQRDTLITNLEASLPPPAQSISQTSTASLFTLPNDNPLVELPPDDTATGSVNGGSTETRQEPVMHSGITRIQRMESPEENGSTQRGDRQPNGSTAQALPDLGDAETSGIAVEAEGDMVSRQAGFTATNNQGESQPLDVVLALVEAVLRENSVPTWTVTTIMSDLEQRFSYLSETDQRFVEEEAVL